MNKKKQVTLGARFPALNYYDFLLGYNAVTTNRSQHCVLCHIVSYATMLLSLCGKSSLR